MRDYQSVIYLYVNHFPYGESAYDTKTVIVYVTRVLKEGISYVQIVLFNGFK